jgi:hypothetical protein
MQLGSTVVSQGHSSGVLWCFTAPLMPTHGLVAWF